MIGCVFYHERAAREEPTRCICGARFRAVYVARGEGLSARVSAWAAARTLARAGVRRALFPTDYAFRAVFARAGVGDVSPVPLRLAAAAQITRRYMDQRALDPSRCTVLLAAEGASRELYAALAALSAEVRRLALSAPGGAALARALRRELGVAVAERAANCDLTVAFSPVEAAGELLALYDPALVVEYDAALPERTLAALWELGALDANTLRVTAVRAAEESEKSK